MEREREGDGMSVKVRRRGRGGRRRIENDVARKGYFIFACSCIIHWIQDKGINPFLFNTIQTYSQ